MTDEQFQQIAKAIADPSRLAALEMIARQGEVSCSAVRDRLCVTAATVSHHVKELAGTGLIHYRKEAKYVMLRLNRKAWSCFLRELERRVPKA